MIKFLNILNFNIIQNVQKSIVIKKILNAYEILQPLPFSSYIIIC